MKKIIVSMLAIVLIVSMALPTSAMTTGKWVWNGVVINPGPTEPEEPQGEHTVTYDYNGGQRLAWTGERIRWEYRRTYTTEGSHTVPESIPWRYGRSFAGWLGPDGRIYQPGEELTVTGDITLTAQWEADN